MSTWLVTGAAGFIGAHLCARLLADGERVVGVDDVGGYYDPALKRERLAALTGGRLALVELDVADPAFAEVMDRHRPDVVVHLAAQAGARHSLDAPLAHVHANLVGFANVLEACRQLPPDHLVYASSSSVYGVTSLVPLAVDDPADHPVSLYAATKRSGELMAHAYSHLHGLPTTGLRLFTVYGPWGRPDMAYFLFADAIAAGRPVRVFGDGSALRDLTFVDDIVEGIVRVAARPPKPDESWAPEGGLLGSARVPWRLLNIGHGQQVSVSGLVDRLEQLIGRPAVREHTAEAPGDVPTTRADTSRLEELTGFTPQVGLDEGLERFVAWHRSWRGWA